MYLAVFLEVCFPKIGAWIEEAYQCRIIRVANGANITAFISVTEKARES